MGTILGTLSTRVQAPMHPCALVARPLVHTIGNTRVTCTQGCTRVLMLRSTYNMCSQVVHMWVHNGYPPEHPPEVLRRWDIGSPPR